MEHTKGIWEVRRDTPYSMGGWKVYTGRHENNKTIVHLPYGSTVPVQKSEQYYENKANAHLIAAAPELLEACKYVVQYHKENDNGEGELFGLDFVTTCIAAINKAEGN